MADWKKVLVSGSDIHVSSITASNIPAGTSTDEVIVLGNDGEFRKVTQGSIQGTTEATFSITGSGTNHTASFDGTGDVLIFTGSSDVSVDVTQNSSETTVKVNLPPGTISGSSQISLTSTDGFTAFSSSFATSISGNLADIDNALSSITDLETTLSGLVDSSSILIEASSSIADELGTQSTNITNLQSSITSLETFSSSVVDVSQTGSFVVSASVIGTDNEIEITSNGSQGIQIGLPNDVNIPGILEAEAIVIQGENVTETGASIISGSTKFGTSGQSNIHRFTGSLEITGSFVINNTNTNVTISDVTTDNNVGIDNIIARRSSDGRLYTAGTAIGTAISGAFDTLSSSFAADIATLDSTTTTANESNITNLQTISQSLVDSASLGIRFAVGDNGSSIGFAKTASFTASGDGLTVGVTNTSDGVTFDYTLNSTTVGNAIGAYSSSTQLQEELDSIYVQLTDAPISGAEQLQTLGFITASDFNQLIDLPSGIISGVLSGDGDQGTIKINGNDVSIQGLGESDSPTFNDLTVTNNLTISGDVTSFNVDNLNIEDQFILINSGAGGDDNDKDGGIIVDNGGGSGSLFVYDYGRKVWGFRGATDSSKVNYNAVSDSNSAENTTPEVFVGTVSSSGDTPTSAPAYGLTDSTAKGQMHINTSDSSIWIYV
jgi:hypothetical protein